MTDAIILRRRRLGKTSAREIATNSTYNVLPLLHERLHGREAPITFRWGCTASIPYDTQVINSASSIHRVNDKLSFRMTLNEQGLCPPTWTSVSDWLDCADVYPNIIARPALHSRGRHILSYNITQHRRRDSELARFTEQHPLFYLSEHVNKVAEYRVFVVCGRVVAVARKYPGNPHDIAWNVARGGRFENVRWDAWPLKAVRYAIEAFNLSGLDFGGVDVMIDGQGRCYVLEINSAPSLTSPYRQEAMAKAFDYIIATGKDTIPLTARPGGYRKFIHPAVCDRAILV